MEEVPIYIMFHLNVLSCFEASGWGNKGRNFTGQQQRMLVSGLYSYICLHATPVHF